MSTQKEVIDYILETLQHHGRFTARKMFGEYALYADQKVVGLVCDNNLYVKIVKESNKLEALCEKHPPYPGAKDYYLVEESQLEKIKNLPSILIEISRSLPAKKPKPPK